MFSLRRSLTATLFLTILLAAMGGCSPAPAPARTHAEIVLEAGKAGLKEIWHRRLPLLGGEKWINVWRVGDSIYATTTSARLIRLNAISGALAWDVELGNPEYPIFRPADVPNSDYLLVVNKGRGFLLHKKTGDILMQSHLSFAASTDPTIVGNCFLLGGVESFRSAYLDFKGTSWNVTAPGHAFTVRPTLEGDSISFSTDTGRLWRVNASDGKWIWRDRSTGPDSHVVGGLASDARAVYVPCLDGKVFAFDMNNGSNLWYTLLEGRLDQNLTCTRSDLLVPASGKGLYNLNTSRGDIRWFVPDATTVGTIIRGSVWVSDSEGNLKAISLDTGDILATANVGGKIVNNTVDQLVITITHSGELTVYSVGK
ncbi:MAG: PQQ-binding-like beta-propeller repeat protein [Phycisphaerales bacterium]|nr:PQQ-binding-like beta-propeller repeat protein [Phycisphaerales bacterium]